MTEIRNLSDLFYHELQVLWSAEKMLLEAMPLMIDRAQNEGLKKMLSMHLAETDQHKVALEGICKQLGIDPEGDYNPGMKGIIQEGEKVMAKDATPEAMDAALITGAQKVEHYEISGYGSVRTFAEMLGETEAARLLQETLDEEVETDEMLTELAESSINADAEEEEAETE